MYPAVGRVENSARKISGGNDARNTKHSLKFQFQDRKPLTRPGYILFSVVAKNFLAASPLTARPSSKKKTENAN